MGVQHSDEKVFTAFHVFSGIKIGGAVNQLF